MVFTRSPATGKVAKIALHATSAIYASSASRCRLTINLTGEVHVECGDRLQVSFYGGLASHRVVLITNIDYFPEQLQNETTEVRLAIAKQQCSPVSSKE